MSRPRKPEPPTDRQILLHILAILQKEFPMSAALDQAVSDLTTATATVASEGAAAVQALGAVPNDSAAVSAIEAAVTSLNATADALKGALVPPAA